MPVAPSLKKIQRNYQDYGLKVTLLKTCAAAVSVVYGTRVYRIYRIRLDRFTPPDLDTGRFHLRLLEQGEEALIRQIENMEEWLSGQVGRKLASGSLCLVALDGERVAGFNLVSFGKVYMPLVEATRTFRDNEAWSEQITVGRNYRGRGLAATLRLVVFGILKERGVTRFYGGTLPLNVANRKLSRKVGFQEIADIHFRRVLGSRSWEFRRLSDHEKAL